MRRILLLVLLAAIAVPLHAQKSGDLRFFGFVTNPGYTESDLSGSNFDGAIGVGLDYWFSPRWSGSLNVSADRAYFTTFQMVTMPDGILYDSTTRRETYYPIDALARYHFIGTSRWKPYVGAGLEYRSINAPRGFAGRTSLAAEVNGGVVLELTQKLGVGFDAKRLLHNQSPGRDNQRFSLGLTWKF